LGGNAAGMIDEEGVSKGGSWKHMREQHQRVNRIPNNGPFNWLGFRCVAEAAPIDEFSPVKTQCFV
jgi:hypothetical protein